MTPLAANFANTLNLKSTTAVPSSLLGPQTIPIQIYIPKIVLHPRAGTTVDSATDCILLGHTSPNSTTLTLTHALFLSLTVWESTLNRVRQGRLTPLETYTPPPNHPRFRAGTGLLNNPDDIKGPHKAVYEKVRCVYGFMANCGSREEELTKRWKVTKGPLTERQRGAVWEGWGVYVDAPIEMQEEERKGAFVVGRGGDGGVDGKANAEAEEEERRMREIEELLEEEEESEGDPMEE
ncbi:hypothetical protein K458DRAFT_411826 [Lentithecium fluviatile CBS 122367]|uniref:Uncharacterized protein n=1 Tax=Lentithecium fluviatile CBS 122367 TaxID=1168545 RepID=A0A6G1JNQ9_9PLEO|nr:hypothetical protein K458DRAFT_411826 [Lentithecium fluviatile CBS 122367]